MKIKTFAILLNVSRNMEADLIRYVDRKGLVKQLNLTNWFFVKRPHCIDIAGQFVLHRLPWNKFEGTCDQRPATITQAHKKKLHELGMRHMHFGSLNPNPIRRSCHITITAMHDQYSLRLFRMHKNIVRNVSIRRSPGIWPDWEMRCTSTFRRQG